MIGHLDASGVEGAQDDEFVRVPGLFRRWELAHVIELGVDFHFEAAGRATDGTELIAVYRREPPTPTDEEQ